MIDIGRIDGVLTSKVGRKDKPIQEIYARNIYGEVKKENGEAKYLPYSHGTDPNAHQELFDAIAEMAGIGPHDHDDLYYTKKEIDDLKNTLNDSIDLKASKEEIEEQTGKTNKKFEELNETLDQKAAAEKVYTKEEINEKLEKIDEALTTVASAEFINSLKSDVDSLKEQIKNCITSTDMATFKKKTQTVVDLVAITSSSAVKEFTTSKTPNDDHVEVIINNFVYLENVDFSVNRSAKKITWVNNTFTINSALTSKVLIKYTCDM